MFPPKKKKTDVTIVVGAKPEGMSAPKPFERKDEPDGDESEMDSAHEAAESPEQESAEEEGADLLADIAKVGEQYGADSETSKAMAAEFFEAIAKCLRGDKQPEAPTEEEDIDNLK